MRRCLFFTVSLLAVLLVQSDTTSFLERQRQLAEEQWQRELQSQSQSQEMIDEHTDHTSDTEQSSDSYEYYVYYYEDEDEPAAPAVDIPVRKERIRGFKKNVGSGIHKTTVPFSMDQLVKDAIAATKCVKRGESVSQNNVPAVKPKPQPQSASKSATSSRSNYKQRQEEKRKEKEEQAVKKAALVVDDGAVVGADCESQVCGACKIIVEEFGRTVFEAIDNQDVEYIYDLAEGFCEGKDIALRYHPLVGNFCSRLLNDIDGYRDMFVRPFEADEQWDDVMSPVKSLPKKKKICLAAGMCDRSQFEFDRTANALNADDRTDTCYVCHALANDLEERVSLTKKITEGLAVDMVKQTCGHMEFSPSLAKECQSMTTGALLDEIAWIVKLHAEALSRKEKSKQAFADKLCEEVKLCEKPIDPSAVKEEEVEAVFW